MRPTQITVQRKVLTTNSFKKHLDKTAANLRTSTSSRSSLLFLPRSSVQCQSCQVVLVGRDIHGASLSRLTPQAISLCTQLILIKPTPPIARTRLLYSRIYIGSLVIITYYYYLLLETNFYFDEHKCKFNN